MGDTVPESEDAGRGRRRVAVLGGGIAGLSVAHQLAAWNRSHPDDAYEITVFDSHGRDAPNLGGKARSWHRPGPIRDDATPGEPLAGEHGFRFFPGFYQHVTATMDQIPAADGRGTVADHLVPLTETAFYARHIESSDDVPSRVAAIRARHAIEKFGPPVTALWLVAVPIALALLDVDMWIWIVWAAAMPLRTLLRWVVEAASSDGTAELSLPLRSDGTGVDQCHTLMRLQARIPGGRWWWAALVPVMVWWSPPWPVWAAAAIVAFGWMFLRPLSAIGWLWRELRSGIPLDVKPRATESMWAALSVIQLMTSCRSRIYGHWDNVSWWDLIRAWRFSERFQLTLATGLTRSFVATKAERMSARTGGLILAQLIYDINPYLTRDNAPDRVLDGPTSDVWIIPWVDHLIEAGVRFNVLPGDDATTVGEDPETPSPAPMRTLDHCLVQRLLVSGDGMVEGFEYADRTARGGVPKRAGEADVYEAIDNRPTGATRGHFDRYVLAVPGPAAQRILGNSAELVAADRSRSTGRPVHPLSDPEPVPHLDAVFDLEFGWMTGIVFHLDRHIELPRGHMLCLDSEWALTAIDERPVWSLDEEDGGRNTILSVDVSDWFRPSSTGLPAQFGELADIVAEVWRQLQEHIVELRSVDVPAMSRVLVDTAITDPDPMVPGDLLRGGPPPLIELTAASATAPTAAAASTAAHPAMVVHPCTPSGPGRPPASLEIENLPLNNADKLLINTAGSWRARPCAVTAIDNLFVAGDYVRTSADFASMESADEAARWAARALIASDHPDAPLERLGIDEPDGLQDPVEFRGLLRGMRWMDKGLFWIGLPNPLLLIATPIGWVAGIEDRFRRSIERRFRPPGLPRRGETPTASTER